MALTTFKEYYDKYLKMGMAKILQRINDTPEDKQPKLLYKVMLTSEQSLKDSWDSASLSASVVSADVVAMDSPLPLKSRARLARATGKIPKIGISFRKRESEIRDLLNAQAVGGAEAQIATRLLADVDLCVKGIEVAKEVMFLQGLSTGQTLVKDEDSDGHGVRVDFGYAAEHTYTVGKRWSEADATPISDMQVVLDAASTTGRPELVMLSRKALDNIRKSAEGKQVAMRYQGGAVVANVADLPTPSRSVLVDALKDELGVDVRVVDSSFRVQTPDGKYKTIAPWEVANVVFLPSSVVGRLVWVYPVEKMRPAEDVIYTEGDHGTLVSVYHEKNPMAEVTMGQAHAIPVIDGGDQVYLIETETATTGSKKETKAKA